jgi:predicted DNA-binding protein YlxM (UPF0122 family)
MKIEDNLRIIRLIDTYGLLLTSKQYQIVTSYYFDNLSLSEIGDNYNISRQAVSDCINQSIKALDSYEDKLKIISNTDSLQTKLNKVIDDCKDQTVAQSLRKIIEDIRG